MKEVIFLYKDQFERSSRFIEKQLENEFEFRSVNFAEIAKSNINEKSKLGIEANSFIKKGEYIPSSIFHKMVVNKIEELNTDKILLISYPKTEEQLELLNDYTNSINANYTGAYYVRTINTEQNFNKDEKMMKNEEKYKSKEYILMNSKRTKEHNESIIDKVKTLTNLIEFNVEAFGIRMNEENEQIRRTIHNK